MKMGYDKISKKDKVIVMKNENYYHIKYITPYGKGFMNIDTKLFDIIAPKFWKAFQDADIQIFETRKKGKLYGKIITEE